MERARREAVGGVLDPATAQPVDELRSRDDVAAALIEVPSRPEGPVIDLRFEIEGAMFSFFSVVSTIGTPADVTAQELRVETFFPSDKQTADTWNALT